MVDVPTIANFEMVLQYPSYLGKNQMLFKELEMLVPEGTVVDWRINALATDKVSFKSNNQVSVFANKEKQLFTFRKNLR